MSGGQRQRVGIARALALEPGVHRLRRGRLGARRLDPGAGDQPARGSARASFGLTYLFIAHDLSVVRHLCQRVAVMYLGRIVELAGVRRAVRQPAAPLHPGVARPRCRCPIRAVEATRAFRPVQGEVPSPINPPPGCVFHPRCPIAVASCKQARPELRELRPEHWVACSEVRLATAQRSERRRHQRSGTCATCENAWRSARPAARRCAASAPPASAETPKRGGTLTYMIPADAPPSFDGHRETHLRDGARGGAVLQRADPGQPGKPVLDHRLRLRSVHGDAAADR